MFKRLPRSVEVTAQGDAFLPYIRSALDMIVKGIQKNKKEYQDRNKISFISDLCGKDLEVMAKALSEYNN